MQTTLEILFEQKYLAFSLLICSFVIILANLIGQETAIVVGNLMYIPTAGALLILALVAVFKFGTSGYHGIAWFAFAGYVVSMFVAEMLWILQELYLQTNPFPSAADVFYLVGYPFLLLFLVSYLQPVRGGISKKVVASATAFSAGMLSLSMYLTLGNGIGDDAFVTIVGAIYPVFDSIVIIPALVGVVLFFKGKVNFMWSLLCLGSICVFAADTAFLLGQSEDSYYTGNVMEIPFYFNYILLAFGVKNHISLFKRVKKKDDFDTLGT